MEIMIYYKALQKKYPRVFIDMSMTIEGEFEVRCGTNWWENEIIGQGKTEYEAWQNAYNCMIFACLINDDKLK